MVRNAAAAAAVAGLAGLGVASAAFQVVAPEEGMTIISDRTYTVKWTGNFADSLVYIDLYFCGSGCGEDSCGEYLTALCPEQTGCPDSAGDYDIVMPLPLGVSDDMYKVRVTDAADETNFSCSGGFMLLAPADDDAGSNGPATDATMTITSPQDGDLAFAGSTYTVLFDYADELGSSVGRFSIDLYESDGVGDCGTYVTFLCDKPTIGCKDSQGDYDVEIPEDTPEGSYKIRVGLYGDDETFDCSGEFIVTPGTDDENDDGSLDDDEITFDEDDDMESDDGDDDDMSYSYRI